MPSGYKNTSCASSYDDVSRRVARQAWRKLWRLKNVELFAENGNVPNVQVTYLCETLKC